VSCQATTPAKAAIFRKLQNELNRVRPMVGLVADVPVTGIIDVKTVAKTIKFAQKLFASTGGKIDPIFYNYAVEVADAGAGQGPVSQISLAVLAADAGAIIEALGRLGVAPGTSVPGSPGTWPGAEQPPQLPTKPGTPGHGETAITPVTKKTLLFAGGAILFLGGILILHRRRTAVPG
jgi:hypothetical protein